MLNIFSMNDLENINDILSLEYHGEPVDLGRMNSYQVAASIIAFSDFLGVIAENVYGEKIELKTEIQGIRGESFDIDFCLVVCSLGIQTVSLLGSSLGFKEYFDFIKEAIKAWLHLKGMSPKQVTPQSDNSVKIENQDGQIIYVNNSVINIITSNKAGKAVEQFIGKPLEEGISSLSIKSPKLKEATTIEKKDATCFKQVGMERPVTDAEIRMALQIQSPTFKEGNKWQFFDGQNSFYADIQDENFLAKVDKGVERFGKGDTLIVKMRIMQSSTLGALSLERSVIEVLDHTIPPGQAELL